MSTPAGTSHTKPTYEPRARPIDRLMKCSSPICKGQRRWFGFNRTTEMGEKVYVCETCGQEQKVK